MVDKNYGNSINSKFNKIFLDDLHFSFLLTGLGFVAIAGVFYYLTKKPNEVEEKPRKVVVQPSGVFEVKLNIYLKYFFLKYFIFS